MLEWGSFRDSIKELELKEQIEKIAEYFSSVPIAPRQLDYYTPDTWPTPWELLDSGHLCSSGISILMAYTLLINEQSDFKLLLIDDNTDYYLVPLVADEYILNYSLGEVMSYTSISNDITIKYTYNPSDLKDIY